MGYTSFNKEKKGDHKLLISLRDSKENECMSFPQEKKKERMKAYFPLEEAYIVLIHSEAVGAWSSQIPD